VSGAILLPAAPPGGSGAVSSVFGRTGAVTAETGDYDVAEVTGAAPLASPAFTGTPTGISGQYLCAPVILAPASVTDYTTSSTTLAAVSSGNASTGAFTAPASGKVIVTVSLVAVLSAAGSVAFALAAEGTVTPVVGYVVTYDTTATLPDTIIIPVTGLTGGDSYTLDLLFGVSSGSTTLTVATIGNTSTAVSTTRAGPLVITVQAV
jgi:hypothetical protein